MTDTNKFIFLRLTHIFYALCLAITLPAFAGTGQSYDEARVVTNYAEFKAAMEDKETGFIKVGNIDDEILMPKEVGLMAGATIKGYKTLILAGDATFTAPAFDSFARIDCLLQVPTQTRLAVYGKGTLTFKASLTNGTNAVIRIDGGTVEILSDDVTLAGDFNLAVYGNAIYMHSGDLTINGGTFTGKTAMTDDKLFGAVTINKNSSSVININGGTFSATAVQGSNKTAGLQIDEAIGSSLQITKGNFLISKAGDYSIAVSRSTVLSTSKNVSAYITAPYQAFEHPAGSNTVSTNTAGITQSVVVNSSIIEAAALTVDVPVAGQTPQAAKTTTMGAAIASTTWKHEGTLMNAADVFEAGEEYELAVVLEPASNSYSFALDEQGQYVSVTLNGESPTSVNDNTANLTVSQTFTAAAEVLNIDAIALIVIEPVAGQTPKEAITTTNNTTIYLTEWRHNGSIMEPTDVFEIGEEYQMAVIVYPADGYSFLLDPVPSVTLNGVVKPIYSNGTDFVTTIHKFTVAPTTRLVKNSVFATNKAALNKASRSVYDISGKKMSSENLLVPGLYVKKVPNSTISH